MAKDLRSKLNSSPLPPELANHELVGTYDMNGISPDLFFRKYGNGNNKPNKNNSDLGTNQDKMDEYKLNSSPPLPPELANSELAGTYDLTGISPESVWQKYGNYNYNNPNKNNSDLETNQDKMDEYTRQLENTNSIPMIKTLMAKVSSLKQKSAQMGIEVDDTFFKMELESKKC